MSPPRRSYTPSSDDDGDAAASDSGSASRSATPESAPRGQLLRHSRARRSAPRVHSSSEDDRDDSERAPSRSRSRSRANSDFDDDDDEEDESVKRPSKTRRPSSAARGKPGSASSAKKKKGGKLAGKRPASSGGRYRAASPDDEDNDEDEMDVDGKSPPEKGRFAESDSYDSDESDEDEDADEDPYLPASKRKEQAAKSKTKARARAPGRSKPRGSKARAKPKPKMKTPDSAGRRNPTRSTRGQHSALEIVDDDDEFLASDAGEDVPVENPFEGIDIDNLAPSIYAFRNMEKILGRRHRRDPSAHPPPISDANSKANPASPRIARRMEASKGLADEKGETNAPNADTSLPAAAGGDDVTPAAGAKTNSPDPDAAASGKKPSASPSPAPKPTTPGDSKPASALPRRDTKTPSTAEPGASEYEYLVKWKQLSYIHCEWVDESVVLKQSQGKSRLRRFMKKQEYAELQRGVRNAMSPDSEEDELIPEDFVTIDRVLADRVNARGEPEFFVKWCSLPYADSSWELAEDVKDDNKIEEYRHRSKKPSDDMLRARPRPNPADYRTLPMPTFRNDGALRDYQMEGFNWLVSCWFNNQGCILADEMGLGKTIQSVSYINELYAGQKILGPFLVLAPLSTLGHWQREFQSWTGLNAIVYHGSTDSRQVILDYEWSYGTPQRGPPFKWHVMITTYETILQDANRLKNIHWKSMVVDEAHRLKNRASRLVDELQNFKADHRVLLTGTPIQNNSLEVWALLNFLEPKQFMSEKEFAEKFGDIKDAETVDKLKAMLRPFLLRRLKEDVEKSIPPKEETVVSVELTRVQKKWYRAMLEQNFSFLDKGAKSSNVGNLRNIVMELRKCCNHPYLIKGVEQIEAADLVPADQRSPMRHLIDASGKMVLVDKLLPELKKKGHRVLVFSQMIRVLDILEDYLLDKRWGYERIDGRVRGNDRQQAIDRFSRPDSDKFVFLLCTRAGGQGINLTVADTVIIYDSDWNPQNDVQAQARCHRIGQKTEVKVYRLITRGTYEQDMFDRASKKLGLDQAILQNMGKSAPLIGGPATKAAGKPNKNTSLLNDMHRQDIDSLLKKGAYDVFNEDNAAADAFTSEDIHEILSRRTKVLRSTAANVGPSEFSKAAFATKASFAAETENAKGPNVDLDDPDFWKKLMPEASVAPDPNIAILPRRRRQTVRYNPKIDSDESEMEEEVSGDEGPAKFGANGKRLFNKGERHRVQRALNCMGWGRWHMILQCAGRPVTDRRDVDELAQFCKALMRSCWDVTEKVMANDAKTQAKIGETKERIKSVLEDAYAPHRTILGVSKKKLKKKRPSDEDDEMRNADSDYDSESEDEQEGEADEYGNLLGPAVSEQAKFADPILETEEYASYLSRNGVSILERMELLTSIRTLVLNGSLEPGGEMPVVGASGSQALEDFWDASFDRDLLRGTHKHGFGNYQQMLADPELVFLGRVSPAKAPEKKDKSGANSNPAESNNNGSDSDGSGNDMSDGEKGPSKKNGKSGSGEANGKEGEDDDSSSGSEAGDDDKPQKVMFVSAEELERRKWPPVNVLNVRVRKLVRGFIRMKKRAERQAKQAEESKKAQLIKDEKRLMREMQKEQAHAERERKAAQANKVWSKKEKNDFCKYYSTNGGPPLNNQGDPSWYLVKVRAQLTKKDPGTVQRYAHAFASMCECILSADEYCSRYNTSMAAYFEKYGPPVRTSADFQPMRDVNNEVPYTLQQLEDARVSVVNAKKWSDRRHMVEALRREVLLRLENPAIVRKVEKKGSPVGRERLPDWWAKERLRVDIGLLQGVATHGFDANQIALDESLPFRDLLAQAVIDYIRETLEDHRQSGREINADDLVIPGNIRDVADPDILTFFPKDKMVVSRTARLINIVYPEHYPPIGSPARNQIVPKAKAPAKVAPRKRAHSVDEQLAVVRPGVKKAVATKSGKPTPSEVLCTMSDGGVAGLVPVAFESAPNEMITRRLLRFLKSTKKMRSDVKIKLNLPDWNPANGGFGRVDMDGEPVVVPEERPVKRRRTMGESSSKGDGISDGRIPNTRNAKDSRVRESIMHKVTKDANGDVVFPVRLGVLTIEALGRVDPTRKAFHTERTIYPIGFRATREYTSMVDINRTAKYVCEILDDGGPAPVFQVSCVDGDGFVKKDSSSSACWTYVMTAIRDRSPEERKRLHTTVSGPEYFGLSHSVVQELVQELPGAGGCDRYVRKTFIKGERGAKVEDGKMEAEEAGKETGNGKAEDVKAEVDEGKDGEDGKTKRNKRVPERFREGSEDGQAGKDESDLEEDADGEEAGEEEEEEEEDEEDREDGDEEEAMEDEDKQAENADSDESEAEAEEEEEEKAPDVNANADAAMSPSGEPGREE